MITNLFKSALAVIATPVALIADVLTLPSTAYNDTQPFAHTAKKLNQAAEAFNASVAPQFAVISQQTTEDYLLTTQENLP